MSRLQHNIQPSLALGSTVEGNKLVTLTGFDFERHKHIIGVSGSGKSSFLASCAILLLKQGVPFTLIDPHGDLCKLILSLLASSDFFRNPKAYDRLWYVDFSREDRLVPFNVLKQPYEPHTVANNLLEATHRAFPVSGTTTSLDNVILAATLVLVESHLPLTALHTLILDSSFRDVLLKNVSDPLVVQFFKSKFSEKVNSQLVDSTLRRSFLLTFSPALRNTLGQRENKLNFRALMDSQTSCIFNLGGLDDSTKRFLGCLLMVGVEQAFLSRVNMPAEKRTPYHVIVDEFPLFSASADSFSVVLEQVRKYKGTLYLAHQTTSQLSKSMTGSLQNAISILFKLGYEDSTWASQRFVRKQEMEEQGFLDMFLTTDTRQSSPFDQVKNQLEAKQVFETLERQEAIVTMNKQALHIRTHTLPPATVDAQKLAEIETVYARKLLTPIATIEREKTLSNMVLVSSPQIAARRVLVSRIDAAKPFRLLTGDFDTDILCCLYHFHYMLLSQLAALLGKRKSENYLRDKKLKLLIDNGLIGTTTLARPTAGKPPTVYFLTAKGQTYIANRLDLPLPLQTGARKHQFLEHSLECNEVLMAALELQLVEQSITVLDVKHERTLKAAPIPVGSHHFVVPDCFLHLRATAPFGVGDAFGIVFEIDRNSESKEKIQQKIEAYIHFTSSEAYRKAFGGLTCLTIAFIVTAGGTQRLQTLLEWSREILNSQNEKDLFVFSAPGSISYNIFLTPVFVTIENVPCALVEKVS
jgi:hypothetical protein